MQCFKYHLIILNLWLGNLQMKFKITVSIYSATFLNNRKYDPLVLIIWNKNNKHYLKDLIFSYDFILTAISVGKVIVVNQDISMKKLRLERSIIIRVSSWNSLDSLNQSQLKKAYGIFSHCVGGIGKLCLT